MHTETYTETAAEKLNKIIETLQGGLDHPEEIQSFITTALDQIAVLRQNSSDDVAEGLDAARGCLDAARQAPKGAVDFVNLAISGLELASLLSI